MADIERTLGVDHSVHVESPRRSYGIPINDFIEKYEVMDPRVQNVLHAFPTLCYLLGNVTPGDIRDSRPDPVERPMWFVTEGSGMFGLTHPDDAMRWKGIFNHIIGSAGQVMWLSELLKKSSPSQREEFTKRGFDISTLEQLDPKLLRDFMLISHAGRRIADENKEANQNDNGNRCTESGLVTKELFKKLEADPQFRELIHIEDPEYFIRAGASGILPLLVDNILTYCDWTFTQHSVSLRDRFDDHAKTKRVSPEVLSVFRNVGPAFEQALREIIDSAIFETMRSRPLYTWEYTIRSAYGAAAQLPLSVLFPSFVETWEKQTIQGIRV